MIDSWLLNWRSSDQLTLLTNRPKSLSSVCISSNAIELSVGNHRISSIVLCNIMVLVNEFEVYTEMIGQANSLSNLAVKL